MNEPRNAPPKSGGGCLKIFGIGCGLFLIGGVAIVIYVWVNLDWMLAEMARAAAIATIESSELPDDQKKAIVGHVDRVISEFQAGRITLDDLETLAIEIQQSPLLTLGIAFVLQTHLIARSGLSAEEQRDAERTIERYARGVIEGSISRESVERLTSHFDGERSGQSELSDAEIRELLAELSAEVEEAGVPDEPYVIDVAAEVGKVVDATLASASSSTDPSSEGDEPK